MSLTFKFVHVLTGVIPALRANALLFGVMLIGLFTAIPSSAAVNESYVTRDGLQLWLDAEKLIPNADGSVSQWPDQSGRGNHAVQPTVAYRPSYVLAGLNNKPVVRFSAASTDYLSVSTAWLNPSTLTLVVVAKRSLGTAAVVVVEKYSGSTGYGLLLNSANVVAARVNGNTVTGSFSSGTFQLFTQIYDQQNNQLFVNGGIPVVSVLTAPIQANASSLTIGGRTTSSNLEGDVAEILLYSRALLEFERKDIEAYVRSKYLVGNSPATSAPAPNILTGTYGTPQQLVLTAPAGTEIRYTLDGSTPTAGSALYSGPISIATKTTVRAVALREGYTTGPEMNETYIIDNAYDYVSRNGLRVWLRADALPVVSAPVAIWADQSGSGNHAAQSVVGYRPNYVSGQSGVLNGMPAVGFTAVANQHLVIPSKNELNPARLTVVGLCRRTVNSSSAMLILEKGPNTSNGYVLRLNTGTQINNYINGNTAYSTTTSGTAVGDYHVYAGCYDLVQNRLYRDDLRAPVAVSAYTADVISNIDPITIGGRASGLGLDGQIVELAVYDRALTDGELMDLHVYFKQRYGLGAMPAVQLAVPVSSVFSGVYSQAQVVSLSAQAGASIYYTTDGSVPQAVPEQLYKKAFTVSASTTIKAMAVKTGYVDSSVLTTVVSIDPTTALLPRSGLRLWLSASSLQPGPVASWVDLSGNGNQADQSTVAYRPNCISDASGGQTIPTVAFTALNKQHLIVSAVNGLTPVDQFSVFMIAKRSTGTGLAMLLDRGVNGVAYGLRLNNLTAQGYVNANVASTTQAGAAPIALGSFYRFGQIYDGANNQLYVNDTAVSVAYEAALLGTGNPLVIGGRSATYNFDGRISEILFYDRALSKRERTDVEAYLYAKYAVGPQPKLEMPVPSIRTGVYGAARSVKLSGPAASTIFYRINGGAWLTYDLEQSPLISIDSTSRLEAYASRSGYLDSDMMDEVFTIDSTTDIISRDRLALWLRSDVGVVVNPNGTVYQWLDQSGNKNHASRPQGDVNLPVFNPSVLSGHAGLTFEGTDFLGVANAPSLDGAQMSIVALVRRTAGTAVAMIVEKGNGSQGYSLRMNNMTTAAGYMNGNSSLAADLVSGDPQVLECIYDQAKHKFMVAGASKYEGTYTAAVVPYAGNLTVGGRGAAYNFAGDIIEMFVYTRALGESGRRALESYFYEKYSVGNRPALVNPTSSVQSGVYAKEQSISLASQWGGVVHYTLDGSVPTINSPVYDQPISVLEGQSRYIRAMAIDPSGSKFFPSGVLELLVTVDSTAWLPRAGLKLWLRADALAAAFTGPVSIWVDQSGRGNNAVLSSGVSAPVVVDNMINGRAAIHFSSVDQACLKIAAAPDLNPMEFTIYAVARRNAGSGITRILRVDPRLALNLRETTLASVDSFGDQRAVAIEPGAFNAFWGMQSVELVGAPSSSYRLQAASSSSGINGLTHSLVANSTAYDTLIGGPSAQDGDVAEIWMYDRKLTDSELQELHAYVSRKYKIGQSIALPAPVFNIGSGRYAQPQVVTISAIPESVVYYTLDGTEPSASSMVYGSSIAVSGNATIKAKATRSGYLDSPVAVLKLQIGASESEIDEGVPAGYSTDTDGDGVPDAIETALGRDPGNPFDAPLGAIKSYDYDPLHQLQSGPGRTYQYDNEGNVISQ